MSLLVPEISDTKGNPRFTFQSISKIDNLPQQMLNSQFTYSQELQQHLQGKKLLLDEIPFPIDMIHCHYQQGYLQYHHGVTKKGIIYTCNRCGNEDQYLFASFHCARCHELNCTYCRKCITMGRVSECTPLLTWTGPYSTSIPTLKRATLDWKGQLSPGQQTASDEVVHAISQNENLLVWAVCGSGKTEVLFQGILTALTNGKRVCITTPRTDVVLELTPRIRQAFPNTELISLYGGSEDRGKTAQLTIATTHQLLRYHKNFDVVIIDEVDAFPYSADEMLQYAVHNSKKPQSSTIYLTATPNKQFQKQSKKGILQTATIPARYHRHPLPVPTFRWCGNWQKLLKTKHMLPKNVENWILEHLENQKQAFLFVPKIEILDEIVMILQQIEPTIDGVHAEDLKRKEKVQAFRDSKIPIIVTTTILERGVTVPNTDVAVIGTEDSIFTESALVQIAGRVGRSPKYPSGEVIFFHFGKTYAMNKAKTQILSMNKLGKGLGLID
ncbi:DEAD/DEAH box helicase [Bacillus sp. Marseille-P3661]|uniref:DEAD/DEAH box helicase n=1 Tax=Bacillus sp. Marseille-P3661 TaxID=1936234 RepID=UPI000C85669C|nr:DEAD/DEAH box helicase [Bacillus sp. Marseille-P3661]